MKHRRKILIVLAGLLGFFLLLNLPYFWVQAKHLLFGSYKTTYQNQPAVEASEKIYMEPNTLVIEDLGIEAPVVYVEEKSEKTYQAALQNGVVHYPGTAKPGEAGNVYIFGHSSDYLWSRGNYKTVFALLPRVEIGALVNLSNEEGEIFTYTITDKFVASPKDTQLLSQDTGGKKILTLQTSYPIGTALKRYIVIAELINQ